MKELTIALQSLEMYLHGCAWAPKHPYTGLHHSPLTQQEALVLCAIQDAVISIWLVIVDAFADSTEITKTT